MRTWKSGRYPTGPIAEGLHSGEWRPFFVQKSFKNIDEQIELLKSRGLTIEDENIEYVRKYFLTNNYYDIINGYSKPFLKCENTYIKGATFNEVRSLYLFDKELKQVLFNSTLDVEHHLKSIFAYRFAEEHKDRAYPYLDVTAFDHEKSLDIAKSITNLDNIIKRNKKYKNNSIYHYYNKYKNIPIWVLVDYLTFGDILYLIQISPEKIQNTVARDLTSFICDNDPDVEAASLFPPQTMISLIKNIHELRNTCAHNNRLLYFKCRSNSIYFEQLHKRYNINTDDRRNNVYTTFISMQCFISKEEFRKLNNTIAKRFKTLNNKLNSIDVNEIEKLLGFPNHWFKTAKLPQASCQIMRKASE